MSLEELEKKLYKKDSKFEKRPEAPTIFEPGKEPKTERKEEMWRPELSQKRPLSKKQKIIIFSIIGFILVAIIVSIILYLRFTAFIKTDVVLRIYGPKEIISGAESSYELILKNKTKVALKDAKLLFTFPEDSESKEGIKIEKQVGDILSNQEKRLKFNARIFGAKDEIKILKAKLFYIPENINSVFENEVEFKVKIILVPIVFNFNLPQRAANDKDFEMSLNVVNNSNASFNNIMIKIDYPLGYKFVNANIMPIFSNDTWFFENLAAGEQKTIKIIGRVSGADGEIKDFSVKLGRLKDKTISLIYIEQRAGIKISSSLLSIFTTVNNSRDLVVDAGDTLKYKIRYKNTTDANISNVIVKANLDSKILDLSTLDISFGYFDFKQNAVLWTAASVPDFKILGPQKEGELSFSVKVKPLFSIKTSSDKNFTIKTIVQIDASGAPASYSGVPVGSEDILELKANSIVQINAVGYYKNNTIPNSGPIPPRVGQKTTYTIFWQIINYSNDLEMVEVEGVLPPNVIWQDRFLPNNEKLSYDRSSSKIIWSIDRLIAGTGITLPVRQIAFQVAIVPSPDQIGQELYLLSDIKIKAKDAFTGSELISTTKDITTRLTNDPFVGYKGGFVEQ